MRNSHIYAHSLVVLKHFQLVINVMLEITEGCEEDKTDDEVDVGLHVLKYVVVQVMRESSRQGTISQSLNSRSEKWEKGRNRKNKRTGERKQKGRFIMWR